MGASNYKRINILIREEQYENVSQAGLSLSGLVRDLLDDRFSETSIQLNLSKRGKELYEHVVSNLGASDEDLEHYFVEALDKFLADKTKEIDQLRQKIRREQKV